MLKKGEHKTSASNQTQSEFNNMSDAFFFYCVIACLLTKQADKGPLYQQSKKRQAALYINLIIQEENQHSNCKRPSADPTSVILQTSKSWRKMSRDLQRDVKGTGNLSWSLQACPIWWRGESVKCEYVWSEIQQLPLSVVLPSDRDLTSSWRKAAGCGHEVMGSDPNALAVEKWGMTTFLIGSFFLCKNSKSDEKKWRRERKDDCGNVISSNSFPSLSETRRQQRSGWLISGCSART